MAPQHKKSKKSTRARVATKPKTIPAELLKKAKRYNSLGVTNLSGSESASTLRRRIKAAESQHGKDLDRRETHFVRVPKNKAGKAALAKAKRLGLSVTEKGFFFSKERAGEKAKLEITKTGKSRVVIETKGTSPKGRKVTRKKVVPLQTADDLLKTENKLENEFEKQFAAKGRNEQISFRVTEKGKSGYSKMTFQDAASLMQFLRKYENRPSNDTPLKKQLYRAYFFRHVEIITTTRSELKARTTRGRAVNKTGRSK